MSIDQMSFGSNYVKSLLSNVYMYIIFLHSMQCQPQSLSVWSWILISHHLHRVTSGIITPFKFQIYLTPVQGICLNHLWLRLWIWCRRKGTYFIRQAHMKNCVSCKLKILTHLKSWERIWKKCRSKYIISKNKWWFPGHHTKFNYKWQFEWFRRYLPDKPGQTDGHGNSGVCPRANLNHTDLLTPFVCPNPLLPSCLL